MSHWTLNQYGHTISLMFYILSTQPFFQRLFKKRISSSIIICYTISFDRGYVALTVRFTEVEEVALFMRVSVFGIVGTTFERDLTMDQAPPPNLEEC